MEDAITLGELSRRFDAFERRNREDFTNLAHHIDATLFVRAEEVGEIRRADDAGDAHLVRRDRRAV